MKFSQIPLRLTTGAFILNSGMNKRNLDAESAAGLQGMAANAFPQLAEMEPEKFGKLLSAAEIGVGATLLAPFVPGRVAGLVLGAFSGGLITMYLKTPGLTEEDGIRPTQGGTSLAKDFWLAGIAASLLLAKKARTKVKTVKVPAPAKAGATAAAVKGAGKAGQKAAGKAARKAGDAAGKAAKAVKA